MPSAVFELFRQAIAEKKQIVCTYHGLIREVCPHAVGYGPRGNEQALTYQFGGRSSKGLPASGEWRCLELPAVRNPTARDGDWHTGDKHTRPQRCVARVVLEVPH